MLVDWPLEQLRDYLPGRTEPTDFHDFWATTLAQARAAATPAQFTPYDAGLSIVDVFDVTFSGFAGQPVKAWLLLPRHIEGPLPCVVEYVGYNGGRGLAHEWLHWSAAGYAHLVMDTRGQGSNGSQAGDTPDPDPAGGPQAPGFMTRGITSPEHYYYRRVFTDAVRAVDTVRTHTRIDPQRILVTGASQGGGITIAVAGLTKGLTAVMPNVPFLCHYRRATEITDAFPYMEISNYLKAQRANVERVFHTLSYFDGVNFAVRASAPALFSVALMDAICPPSTVFAAYNHYAAPKKITVWPYNGHEGGAAFQRTQMYQFARDQLQNHLGGVRSKPCLRRLGRGPAEPVDDSDASGVGTFEHQVEILATAGARSLPIVAGDDSRMDAEELATALRAWRDRLQPAVVGLPAGGRRRALGLRRQEVATLAGLTVDYLARLEQGRAKSLTGLRW